MRFRSPEIEVLESPLKKRVLRFYVTDEILLVLDSDIDYERATKRHKFRSVRCWFRTDKWNTTMDRREVPPEAIEAALANVRGQIIYYETSR